MALLLHYGCVDEAGYHTRAAAVLTVEQARVTCAGEGVRSKAALLSHYQRLSQGEQPRRTRPMEHTGRKGASSSDVIAAMGAVLKTRSGGAHGQPTGAGGSALQLLDQEAVQMLKESSTVCVWVFVQEYFLSTEMQRP